MAARIAKHEDLERWLSGRPTEQAIAIAARAALRVLPGLAAQLERKGARRFADLILATVRASALARVAAIYPTRANDLRTAAAAAATVDAAAAATADAAAAAATVDAAAAAYAADAAAAMWAQVEADARVLESGRAASLMHMTLWVRREPAWVADNWTRLKSGLREQDRWGFWIDWYEAVLAGRPLWPELDAKAREDLEVRICLIEDDIWAEGAAIVNTEIERLIAEALLPKIPAQGPGPTFAVDDASRMAPQPHFEFDAAGNVPQRIRSLLPLARRAAEDLAEALPPNDPHKLHRDAKAYRSAIDPPPERIDWTEVYGLGLFIENAAAAVEREIADRLTPALEDSAKKALDTLRALHAGLMSASGEARALTDEADASQMTRDEQQALRAHAGRVAEDLNEVATPDAAEKVARAADAIGQGRRPERGTQLGMATLGNAAVVLIAAATAFTLGASVGGAEGLGVQWAALEALKKTPMFANALEQLGDGFKTLQNASGETLYWKLAALAPYRKFVVKNETELRSIAAKSTRMRWALRYIDFIAKTDGSHLL